MLRQQEAFFATCDMKIYVHSMLITLNIIMEYSTRLIL